MNISVNLDLKINSSNETYEFNNMAAELNIPINQIYNGMSIDEVHKQFFKVMIALMEAEKKRREIWFK